MAESVQNYLPKFVQKYLPFTPSFSVLLKLPRGVVYLYRRSQLIEQARRKGYDIKNNDVSWCADMGLIRPREFTKAMYLYSDEDLAWLEKLGELKLRGLEKSVVEKLLRTGTLDIVTEMIEAVSFLNFIE